MSPLHYAVEV